MSGSQRAVWWLLIGVATLLRVVLFSGYGLGDDPNYFIAYHGIYQSGAINPTYAYDFRFAFWVPVVLFMKLLGATEWGFVGFITVCSVLNVVLVYALARQEWEPGSALLAMALAAFLPLEVLSSTLFVIDIPLATYCYVAFWLFRHALARNRIVPAMLAGVFLFLGYSAKQWGVLVGSLFAIEALRQLRSRWRCSAACAATFAGLVAAYFGWLWWRFHDPLYDIHLVRTIAIFLPHSRDIVLDYSTMLFFPTQYGTWFAGWYPHLLVVLALLFVHRASEAGKWLLYFVLQLASLSAMPSHRENGQWVLLVPHIFRYLCFLSIPLCLALAGYVREVLRWRPAIGRVAVGVLLLWTTWQSILLTWPTRDAFGEQRRANAFLAANFPDDAVWSDFLFNNRYEYFTTRRPGTVRFIRKETPKEQATEFERITEGIVVTGGGRLPWYGCLPCAASIAAFSPGPSWRLVRQIDAPTTGYRKEPLRIWRVSRAAERADTLLRSRSDAPALLTELVAQSDFSTAVEVGRTLLERGTTDTDVVYLTGLACARASKLGCASRFLRDALGAGVDQARSRRALLVLIDVEEQRGRFDEALTWAAWYRKRFPDAPVEPAIEELESGMPAAVGLYHLGRHRDAGRRFAAIRDDVTVPSERRRQAHYFLALTLFGEQDLVAAAREVNAYEARYGTDTNWSELVFRQADAGRNVDPATARKLYAEIIEKHPGTLWAAESERQLEQLAGRAEP